MTKHLPKALFVALICLAAPAGAHASVQTLNSIAAVVNDEIITQRQLETALKIRGVGSRSDVAEPLKRRKILEDMIDERLMDQLLSKSNIEVTEEETVRAIANVLHQNGITIDQLRQEISSKGMSWEEYKGNLEKQIKRLKFINQVIGPQVKITDQDLRDYYRRNQDQFRSSVRARIAQIFMPFEDFKSQQEVEAFRDRAVEIASRARRGADFARLAAEHSRGANAENGGDLGMIDIKELPPAVASTIRHMNAGDVSYPIPTENGLMIVKVLSLPELSASDFERLRDDIYAAFYDVKIEEALRAYLQRERSKAYIEIM